MACLSGVDGSEVEGAVVESGGGREREEDGGRSGIREGKE